MKCASGVAVISACHVYLPSSALAPWLLEFLRKLWFPLPIFSLLHDPPPPSQPPPPFLCLFGKELTLNFSDVSAFQMLLVLGLQTFSPSLVLCGVGVEAKTSYLPGRHSTYCGTSLAQGIVLSSSSYWFSSVLASLSLVLIGSCGMLIWIFCSLSVFHYLSLRYSFPM